MSIKDLDSVISQEQRIAQGWDIFAVNGDQSILQVQRIDEDATLGSDTEAYALAMAAGYRIGSDGMLMLDLTPIQDKAYQYAKSLPDLYDYTECVTAYEAGAETLLEDMKMGRSEFHLMLDLSTAHLTGKSFRNLRDGGSLDRQPVRVTATKYGLVFWPTEPNEEADWSDAPELEEINKFAYETGCMLVNFDADAGHNERFPLYEDSDNIS